MTKQELGEIIVLKKTTMWRVSLSILGNETDCEDAIGNTIVKAFEKLENLKEDKFAGTWLIRILINECYNIQRENSRRLTKEEPLNENTEELQYADHNLDRISKSEETQKLFECVKSLPLELRIPVILHYIEGYPVKKIALLQEIPEGTVKSRLKKAREELKKMLD